MRRRAWKRLATTCAVVVVFLAIASGALGAELPLFDGETLEGWTTLDGKPVNRGWEVVDGAIHLRVTDRSAGSILSAGEYGDFDLTFEWKIAPRGNSGLKYRVRNYDVGFRGCEYQIIDDVKYKSHVGPRSSTGALYGLFEPHQDKQLNPPGKYNAARIVARGNALQHWLNGRLIVSATVGSQEWSTRLGESKFAELKDFGRARGRIMLTDHGSEVWFRNFKFHSLDNK
jgi:hypothetical protein